jgi:hypothetical protein
MRIINLTDVTFVMPVRFDSVVRLENALAVITHLHKYFDTNIFVLEGSSQNFSVFRSLVKNKVKYFFIEDNDIIFHKTKYINILAEKVKTPFISIWDADVIADKNQIFESVSILRGNEADVSYPYDGRFLDTSDIIRALFLAKKNIAVLHEHIYYTHLIYGNNMVGGAIIMNYEKYMQSGMDNEDFYGWGNEDYERQFRFDALGYRTHRSKGPVYHLSHPRDMNGMFRSDKQRKWTGNYLKNIIDGSKDNLLNSTNNINSLF